MIRILVLVLVVMSGCGMTQALHNAVDRVGAAGHGIVNAGSDVGHGTVDTGSDMMDVFMNTYHQIKCIIKRDCPPVTQ